MNNEQTYFLPDAEEKIKEALEKRARATKPRNRAERRALMRKVGKKNYSDINVISETAAKLDYIDLIQKFRELNKKKENENYEDIEENS